jgi:hypothetical protein
MTRKIMSDIIVSKKSIRQIPVASEKRRRVVEKAEEKSVPNIHRRPTNPKFAIWFIAGIWLLALFFGLSMVFSSATIIVKPKTEKITFADDTYTAKSETANDTDLTFEVLNVKQSIGENVEATEEKAVSQKATGKIIIYNDYSTAPQRLINNTRFEANNGKIYRINSSVIVPGYKKVGDKITPGSIEATVFADQAGEEFNLKLTDLTGDFKIPGFKGDQRYQSFYARLKEDIVGGFVGKQRIVAEELRKSTEESLKTKLKEQLLKELYAIKPDNYIILTDGYSINYTNTADSIVDERNVKINIEGDLNGIVFNNSKLAKYLANKKITDFDNLPIEIIPAENLVATFKGEDSANLWKSKTLLISLTGDATIKWQYDGDALKKDLAGKKEADLKNLTSKYSDSIVSLKVIFRPIWTRYFPDNPNKIRVEEEI